MLKYLSIMYIRYDTLNLIKSRNIPAKAGTAKPSTKSIQCKIYWITHQMRNVIKLNI